MVSNLAKVSRIIRHHHERMDGRGFPDGLQGTHIPIESRIIAAVNAYDKALNNRAFFASTTPEQALVSLQRHIPHDLDPDIVTVLSSCVHDEAVQSNEDLEVEMSPKDLRVGMVLSRDVRTVSGVLLLPRGNKIQESHLTRILNFQETDPIVDSIHVYRRRKAAV
jgi:hypothetical protein